MKLEEIWSQYREGLKRFLHSKISNEADVDDLLQDILIKTHDKLHQVRDNDSVKSWLFQMANHTIIDFYRKNKKYNELTEDDLWFSDPEADVKKELSHCVDPFVKALNHEQADLLMAIDLNGESQKEYALSLGISYSTLKSRVQKARRELKDIFEDCCDMTLDAQGNLMDYDRKSDSSHKC
ncbi:MAG: RNA polymerase sigma factor SigZ [Bermanella sp.]